MSPVVQAGKVASLWAAAAVGATSAVMTVTTSAHSNTVEVRMLTRASKRVWRSTRQQHQQNPTMREIRA